MKLLRKDVLRWIKNLQSGRYKKGKNKLVSPNGAKFCCLGVWADQHGAVWEQRNDGTMCPRPAKQTKLYDGQAGSYLLDPKLAKGLGIHTQKSLAMINDHSNKGFREVIAFIKNEVLPTAK